MEAKEELKKRRIEKGYTQIQVADLAGIQLRQYQRFELGERPFVRSSASTYLRICKALDFDPYYFLKD